MGEKETRKLDILLKAYEKQEENQKKQAQDLLELSLMISDLKNKQDTKWAGQDLKWQKVFGYLQSDPTTNTEGAIEKLNRIDNKIDEFEKRFTDKFNTLNTSFKVKAAVFGTIATGFTLVIKWIVTKIFF